MKAFLAASLVVAALSCGAQAQMVHDKHATHRMAATTATRAFPVERLEISNAAVVDREARLLRFRDDVIGDAPVIVTFTYAACTTVCPMANAIMAELDARLDARGDTATRLVSVSVDALNDTPEALRQVGRDFGADARWTMVTGRVPEIAEVLRSVGLALGAVEDHAPMFLVGDGADLSFVRFTGLPDPVELLRAVPAE